MGGLLMAFCRPNVGSLRTGDGLRSASRPTASQREALRHTHVDERQSNLLDCPTASTIENWMSDRRVTFDTSRKNERG